MWNATKIAFWHSPFAFSALLMMIIGTGCLDPSIPESVLTALEETRQQYASDKRVALFNIEIRRSGDTLLINGETNLPDAKEALMDKLGKGDLLYKDRIMVLPDPALDGRTRGVVNVSVANIRSKPQHSAELATQAILGMGLKVYKKQGDWYLVQTPDAYLGWMDTGGFALMNEAQYQNWIQAEKVIVLSDYDFVLEAPSARAMRVGDILAGNILAKGPLENGYQGIVFPDGRSGYVPLGGVRDWSSWLEEKEIEAMDGVIPTALQYIGRPYLWGGTSGKGMDCSGFTKTVYFINGMVIPRDASQQVHAGVEVPTDSTLKNLQAGDFIFFGQKAKKGQKEKIRHVGIYLGEGRFIHSGADNPGIQIESLLPGSPYFAPHRLATMVRVRRLDRGGLGVASMLDLPEYFGPVSLVE